MIANRILKVPMAAPDDVAALDQELRSAGLAASSIGAVMCMTEGDGFARGFASLAISDWLGPLIGLEPEDVPERVPLIMIGGCSGLVSPYAAIFVNDPNAGLAPEDELRLSIGITATPIIPPSEVGTLAMVDAVAEAVQAAMDEAGIDGLEDVHNVQIKTPWPSPPELAGTSRSGMDPGLVGAYARAAGALGVAVALGEVRRDELTEEALTTRSDLRSDVASASSGNERNTVAVIVMGNAPGRAGAYRIGHSIMSDGIDLPGVYAALESAGVDPSSPPTAIADAVDHVFVKSAVDGTDECRGRRHVLRTDYLGPFSWLLGKAVIHATVAAVVGDPMMQVSGGGEHQGPPGGGSVAVVTKC